MPSRHRSRERALRLLYHLDLAPQPFEEALAAHYGSLYSEEQNAPSGADPFMEELARGALARREELDALIRRHSQNWRLERMPVVDRNILRLAIWEMTATPTPPAVVINEALELSQRYCEPGAGAFLNGVLDAVRREISQPEEAHDPGSAPQQGLH
ncbi:MAG: transcription antitermination factor NusB [Acidobacteria bacterium]|nr:transcription antitermination factor NusB [Acidobacteriota bacterium]